MRAQLFGRTGTKVIPDDFVAANGPVAVGTMTAPVSIRIPGSTKEWSEELQQNVVTPFEPYWVGRARVQAQTGQDVDTPGGDQVHVTNYLVTVPYAVDAVDPGHLVTVAPGFTGDPSLAGATLRVDDVVRGSIRVERDLFCTLVDDA